MKQAGRALKTLCPVAVATIATVCLTTTGLTASDNRAATLDERIRGAASVVVATIVSVKPEWRENSFGDRLIVSRVELAINEAVKGGAQRTMWLELEGGSVDGITLRVTDLPQIQHPGERAVFLLDGESRGVYTPHLRGQGILFLDSGDIVRGTSLRLDDIRARARALAAGQ